MDASTGQLDMGARWYEPSLGRFSTPDPIMGELTSPLSLNRYLYGLGSPLTHTDPTGLSVRPPESGGGHCGPACMNHVLGDQPSSHHGPGVRRGEQMTPEEAFEAGYRYDSVTDSWYDPCAGVPCSSWDPTDELWGAFKFLVLDDIAACLGGSAVSCAAFLPWGKVLKPFKALKYLRFGDEAAQYGDEVAGVVRHSPVNPGPLADEIAATFRGGSYSSITLSTDVVLYRSWGGRAGELGQYWTRTRPTGPLQSQLDSALDPAWGNTAERVAVIRVPAGTTIYQGAAAPQRIAGGGSLLGGGSQVFIPHVDPSWLV
jgi:RHS repeat-associated protein